MPEDSAELLQRWQAGDQSAAATLFRRYFERLRALAGTRLCERMAARVDADDVVQSVFSVFFHNARDGQAFAYPRRATAAVARRGGR